MDINIGGIRELHPFKNKNGFIWIPKKYRDLYLEHFECINTIAYTNDNIEKLIYIYISTCWLDVWYTDEIDFTPKTTFYPLNFSTNTTFNQGKFARLNSVSTKSIQKIYNLVQAKDFISKSNRCQRLIDIAYKYELPIYIAIRDWIDIDLGYEFRCFVFQDKLTAICSCDDKCIDIDNDELIKRVDNLLKKALYHLPFQDCIMDVFISSNLDCIIEFNSYGVWANGSSGLFNWITDQYDLENSDNVTLKLF